MQLTIEALAAATNTKTMQAYCATSEQCALEVEALLKAKIPNREMRDSVICRLHQRMESAR